MVGPLEVFDPRTFRFGPGLFDDEVAGVVFGKEMIEERLEVGDAFAERNGVVPLPFRFAILEIDVEDAGVEFVDHIVQVDADPFEMACVQTHPDMG